MSTNSEYAENLRRMVEALNSEVSRAPAGVVVEFEVIDHYLIDQRDPKQFIQVDVKQKI